MQLMFYVWSLLKSFCIIATMGEYRHIHHWKAPVIIHYNCMEKFTSALFQNNNLLHKMIKQVCLFINLFIHKNFTLFYLFIYLLRNCFWKGESDAGS